MECIGVEASEILDIWASPVRAGRSARRGGRRSARGDARTPTGSPAGGDAGCSGASTTSTRTSSPLSFRARSVTLPCSVNLTALSSSDVTTCARAKSCQRRAQRQTSHSDRHREAIDTCRRPGRSCRCRPRCEQQQGRS